MRRGRLANRTYVSDGTDTACRFRRHDGGDVRCPRAGARAWRIGARLITRARPRRAPECAGVDDRRWCAHSRHDGHGAVRRGHVRSAGGAGSIHRRPGSRRHRRDPCCPLRRRGAASPCRERGARRGTESAGGVSGRTAEVGAELGCGLMETTSHGMTRERRLAGLCADCAHARRVESARGSVFYLCQRAAFDPAFPKYPQLPVSTCAGYARLPAGGVGHSDSS